MSVDNHEGLSSGRRLTPVMANERTIDSCCISTASTARSGLDLSVDTQLVPSRMSEAHANVVLGGLFWIRSRDPTNEA